MLKLEVIFLKDKYLFYFLTVLVRILIVSQILSECDRFQPVIEPVVKYHNDE